MKCKTGIAFAALVLALSVPGMVSAQDAPNPALVALNQQLAAQGAAYRVEIAETLAAPGSNQLGQTIFANNRGNKQLTQDFVPGDPRRTWGDPTGGTGITWIVDLVDGATSSGLAPIDTTLAIDRAMTTWSLVTCSELPLLSVGAIPVDLGIVQNILGFGGNPGVGADLTHAGWLPAAFFDALQPGGSSSILGITFTFVFIDALGNPTDVDNNGKFDAALREIYYNDAFSWAIDGNIDVETVALHESGHGLSQAHFGKITITNANGKVHFSPRAVMNAIYGGVQQELTGSDIGGHCSNWAQWPNN